MFSYAFNWLTGLKESVSNWWITTPYWMFLVLIITVFVVGFVVFKNLNNKDD